MDYYAKLKLKEKIETGPTWTLLTSGSLTYSGLMLDRVGVFLLKKNVGPGPPHKYPLPRATPFLAILSEKDWVFAGRFSHSLVYTPLWFPGFDIFRGSLLSYNISDDYCIFLLLCSGLDYLLYMWSVTCWCADWLLYMWSAWLLLLCNFYCFTFDAAYLSFFFSFYWSAIVSVMLCCITFLRK